MNKRIEELLQEIAKKHNKPYYVILEIYLSQFRLTRDEIRSFEFKTIKLPSWGKFIPSKDKLSKIDYNKKKKKRDEYNGTKDTKVQALEGTK